MTRSLGRVTVFGGSGRADRPVDDTLAMPWITRSLPLLLAAVLVFAAPAAAGNTDNSISVKSGRLTVSSVRDVTSPAAAARGRYRLLVTVTDARGTGQGWQLRADVAALTVLALQTRCRDSSSCALPEAPIQPRAAGVLLAAAKGTGMGSIDVFLTVARRRGPVAFSVTSA